MITKEELKQLFTEIESDRIERTISITNTDKFGEAICAFANDLPNHGIPGYLLIGVKDDGSLSGLNVTDKVLQNLAAIRDDGNLVPPPAMTVQKFTFPDGDVAVVEVYPSFYPPVRYKGIVWIRIGPRKAKAGESEERQLSEKRSSFAASFDALPCRESSFDVLELDIFQIVYLPVAVDAEVLEQNHRDTKAQLTSLKFYDFKADCPTFMGVLMFAQNPQYFLPGAYIQYVKFDGEDVADEVLVEKRFRGNMVELLRSLEEFIRSQVIQSRPVKVSTLREEQQYNYPEFAVREAVLNAVVHRDYQSNAPIKFYEFANRIEVSNPGGLFGNARPENFPQVNDYRNPNIAEAVKTLGYVNRFNAGVRRMISLMEKNGNPAPEFIKDRHTHFSVILYKKTS